MSDTTEPTRLEAGWVHPPNASKSHYFENGRSLCDKWAFFGPGEQRPSRYPDDCAPCASRLAKRP